jgi:mRNA interferase RelE/StbE
VSDTPADVREGDAAKAWTLDYARSADKDIGRLDPPIRKRVIEALEKLTADPQGGALRKLKGRPEHKLRVGDWRVVVEIDAGTKTITVIRVLPRGRAYDR